MTDFLIRDIEPHVLEHLRRRAKQNGRSLQAEIKSAIGQSVKLNKEESLALMRELRRRPSWTSPARLKLRRHSPTPMNRSPQTGPWWSWPSCSGSEADEATCLSRRRWTG